MGRPGGNGTVQAGLFVVAGLFCRFLVAGGVLGKPVVAAAQANKGGAVFGRDGGVGEVGLGAGREGRDKRQVRCALGAAAAGAVCGRSGSR